MILLNNDNSNRVNGILKHLKISFLLKLINVIISFYIITLTLDVLSEKNYGIWLTLSSVVTGFTFLDIGIGNGLRNSFGVLRAKGMHKEAQEYVSTAYFSLSIIVFFLCFLILCILFFLNRMEWLESDFFQSNDLSVLLAVAVVLFGIQLVLKLIINLYQAEQNHSINIKVNFFTQSVTLIVVFCLLWFKQDSLLIYSVSYMSVPILILIILNLWAFNKKLSEYKPKWKFYNKDHFKIIGGLGFKFFIIQIAATVLFSTDNFIITYMFGPEEVVPYNIAFKYFSIITIGYGLIIAPFWSSFTEANAKNDFIWIKNIIKKIEILWWIVPILTFILFLSADYLYDFWLKSKVEIPNQLSISMAVYVVISSYGMIYVSFVNGIGKVKIQVITAIITVIINIPLSVLLAKSLGASGVIIATSVCMIYGVILRRLQYKKIINGTAKGIWLE